MFTGLVEPKLCVGRFCASDGLEEIDAVSAMLPVKPPDGVRVIVEVFDVIAPGPTLTLVLLMVEPAVAAVVTLTTADPVAEAKFASPE